MKKLGFIGGGNMAEALARGLLDKQVFAPGDLIIADVDASRRRKLARTLKVETTADNRAVRDNSRAILLAVKPQQIDEVMAESQRDTRKRRVCVSEADGGPQSPRASPPANGGE